MNIALIWFKDYGMKKHDLRTTHNVLDANFIAHAESQANEYETELIAECVKFQLSQINGAHKKGCADASAK